METISDLLQGSEPSTWIDALPSFQRKTIAELRVAGSSYDQIAETWVAAAAAGTAPFSSGAAPKSDAQFLNKLRAEIRAYLCGDKKYDKDRKKFTAGSQDIRTFVVSSMAVAISPYVGSAAAVIGPLIALTLAALGKVTLNAWCATEFS